MEGEDIAQEDGRKFQDPAVLTQAIRHHQIRTLDEARSLGLAFAPTVSDRMLWLAGGLDPMADIRDKEVPRG